MNVKFDPNKGLCQVTDVKNCPFMVSPFGIYCITCDSPFLDSNGIQTIKQLHNHKRLHKKKKMHPFSSSESLMKSTNKALSNVKNELDLSKFLDNRIDEPINAYSCNDCKFIHKSCFSLNHHVKAKKHSYEPKLKKHYRSNCSRLIPVELFLSQNQNANGYDIITTNTETVSSKLASSFIREYLSTNESTNIYIPVFTLLIKHFDNDIEKTKYFLGQYSQMLCNDVLSIPRSIMNDDDCKFLEFLVNGFIWWIENWANDDTHRLNAQLRNKLLKFEYNDNEGNSSQNGFNVRKKNSHVLPEIRRMITVIFSFDCTKFSDESFKIERDILLKLTKSHFKNYKQNMSRSNRTEIYSEMTEKVLFQRLLLCVVRQKQQTSFELLLGIVIAICSMLTVKKVKDSADSIQFKTFSSVSTIFGTQLYIYRLATASILSRTLQTNQKAIDDLIIWFRDSHVINTISPLIKNCRSEDDKKVNTMTKSINPFTGDITIKHFQFKRNKWKKMIPTFYDKLVARFEQAFIGQNWKKVLDLSKKIKVDGIKDGVLTENIDVFIFDGDNDDANQIFKASSDINLQPQILDVVINDISAITTIVLSCCGGGATRHTEIDSLCHNKCSYRNDSIYYAAESIKKGNSTTTSLSKVVHHKLSMEMSRVFLLYCIMGTKWKSKSNEYRSRIIFNSNRNQTVSCESYVVISNAIKRNILMVVKDYFDIQTTFNDLKVLRQLYSSLGNAIFSISDETSSNVLEQSICTSDNVALLHGHTKRTHDLHYASKLPLELVYEQYHKALGSTTFSSTKKTSPNDAIPFQPIDKTTLLFDLRSIYGFGGNNNGFLCKEQEEMVFDSSNNYKSHSLYNVGCGKGKSLSWLLPSFTRTRLNQKNKCTIVILPYKFLLHHHHSHVIQTLQNQNIIDVASVSRYDLDIDSSPEFLSEHTNLPHILFLTIDAFHFICSHFITAFREKVHCGYINKIIWDECHTIFTETSFRSCYESIRLYLCSFPQVPVICMSGTFPIIYFDNFCNYLTRKDSPVVAPTFEGKFHIIQDDDPLGSPKVAIKVNICDDINDVNGHLLMCVDFLISYLKTNNDSRIHIITSTKEEATTMNRLVLSRLNLNQEEVGTATGDTEKDLVKDIAQKWSKNLLKILVTTTLGKEKKHHMLYIFTYTPAFSISEYDILIISVLPFH